MRSRRTNQSVFAVCTLTVAFACVWAGANDGHTDGEVGLPLDASLISLNSEGGARLLAGSAARESFIPLIMHFTTQNNTAYCGVASSTMVLNALGIERPISPEHTPYHLFTQASFFTPDVRNVIKPEQCLRSGMTLAVLGQVFKTFPIDVEVAYAKDAKADDFRRLAARTLRSGESFLVVNYLRKVVHQESGGHISPIGAYNAAEDRMLILDVARYKYPPVWVKVDDLWAAMAATDESSNASRGYVIVSKRLAGGGK